MSNDTAADNATRIVQGMGSSMHRRGLQNEVQFLNRVHLGQINSVDSDNGTIDVWVFDIGDQVTVEIPMSNGMSIQRTASSWQRYMPSENAFVLIEFTQANQPYCVGYALLGNDPRATGAVSPSATTGSTPNQGKFVPHIGGYRALRLAKEASDAGTTENDVNFDGSTTQVPIGLRDFTPLRSGEWDQRSSGGAYIRGSRFGQLTLSAAQDYVVIDKQRDEIYTRAGLFKFLHGGNQTANLDILPNDTQARLGDVKRQLVLGDANDTSPPLSGREWLLHVDQPVDCAAVGFTYDERIGDVWSDGPVPIVNPTRRIQKQLTGLGGANLFEFTVDALGNVAVTHGEPTVLVDVSGGPATNLSTSYANTDISSTLTTTISSGVDTNISSDAITNVDAGATVLLGEPAAALTQPTPHGTVLEAMMTQLVTALNTLVNTKNPPPTFTKDPDYIPLQTVLGILQAQLALPPGPAAGPLGPLLGIKVFNE